jgi:hypothetical protein
MKFEINEVIKSGLDMIKKLDKLFSEQWSIKTDKYGKDRYSVSTFGHVRDNVTGVLLTQTLISGSRSVRMFCNSNRVQYLVANAFIPNQNKLHFVIHKDGDKINNNVNNLKWSMDMQHNINKNKIYLQVPYKHVKIVSKKNCFWDSV